MIRRISRTWIEYLSRPVGQARRRLPVPMSPLQGLEDRIVPASDLGSLLSTAPTTSGDNAPLSSAIFHANEAEGRFAVTVPDVMRVGQTGVALSITVFQAEPGDVIDGWIDWDGDGNLGGAAEHVAIRLPILDRNSVLTVNVPGNAQSGITLARFRLSLAEGGTSETLDSQITLSPPVDAFGEFGAANVIDTSAAMQFTNTADLDRDGDLDILAATFDGTGTIAWYENDGHQNWTRRIITDTAAEATCVIAADMNGDGFLDVVASSLATSTIAWYANNGQQQFTPQIITRTAWSVSNLFVADVDGDGDGDILASSKGDNVIAWYENGDGQTFARHVITMAVDAPCVVYAADFDGDGDLDVASASFSSNTIDWYQNDGSQAFSQHVVATDALGVRGMVAADLDGDGDQDLLASCLNSGTIAWYANDGRGNFDTLTITSKAPRVSTLATADVDGDGDFDVVGASRGNTTIAWYENTGSLLFPQHTITTSNVEPRNIHLADVDGDGDLDVVSAAQYGSRLAWFENRPDPLSVVLKSTSPAIVTQPTITMTVQFNRLVNGFTAESLVVENGRVSNFVAGGSLFTFNVIAEHEGHVTVTIPEGVVTDQDGGGNQTVALTREFTSVPPHIRHPESEFTYVRNGPPIRILPELEVAGSRLGGGVLQIQFVTPKRRGLQFDILNQTLLSQCGTLTTTSTDFQRVIQVRLDAGITAGDIQTALRELTFSMSGWSGNAKFRSVQVELTDVSGQSAHTLEQKIRVRNTNARVHKVR